MSRLVLILVLNLVLGLTTYADEEQTTNPGLFPNSVNAYPLARRINHAYTEVRNWFDPPPVLNWNNHFVESCDRPGSKCTDGTYSYTQPECDLSGYEGRCGQTALANLVANRCGFTSLTPEDAIKLGGDITPGTRPSTLLELIKSLGSQGLCRAKKWHLKNSTKSQLIQDIADALKKHTRLTQEKPAVALMVDSPGPHWIVVVGLKNASSKRCRATVNSWGLQFSIPCERLVRIANMNNTWAGTCTSILCPSYTFIWQKP